MRIICYGADEKPLKNFYQWDVNQVISIKGITISPISVFHFCNRLSRAALVVTPVIEEGVIKVAVPNILLQQPETIVVYLYEETPDNGSRTTHTVTIPVTPRLCPDDYEYSENIDYPSYAILDAKISNMLETIAGINNEIESIWENTLTLRERRQISSGTEAVVSISSEYLPDSGKEYLYYNGMVDNFSFTNLTEINGQISEDYWCLIIFNKAPTVSGVDEVITDERIKLLNPDLDLSDYTVVHLLLTYDGFNICCIAAGY